MTILLICNMISTALGLAQVFRPETFNPPVIPALTGQAEDSLAVLSLTYVDQYGRRIIRPCGLGDTPGGGAGAGAMVVLIGLSAALRRIGNFRRLVCLGGAFCGMAVIYYSQVRMVFVMELICLAVLVGVFALQKNFGYASLLGGLGAAMVVGALAWVMATSGRVVVERFLGLAEKSFVKSYEDSGRAGFVTNALTEFMWEVPLGCGIGRWGTVVGLFGNVHDPGPWVEVMIPGWLADGGIPLLTLYFIAMGAAMLDTLRIALRSRDRDIRFWAAVVFASNLSTVATCFSWVTFITVIGAQFWFLAAAIHAADYQARREAVARAPAGPPRRPSRPAHPPARRLRPTRRPRPERNGSGPPSMPRLRVAIVADYPEEGWPSMDLMAEMVPEYLARGHGDEVEATRVCPPYRHRLDRLPGRRLAGVARNADRALNRFADYPRHLRRLARRGPFDVYHIIDHSYAQLALALPPGRAVVTCHDLDAFRCLLRPDLEPRPAWFRALARRALRGLRPAAAVSVRQRGHPLGPARASARPRRSPDGQLPGHRPRVLRRPRPRGRRGGRPADRPARRRPSCSTSARPSPASGSTPCSTSSPASAAPGPGRRSSRPAAGSRPSRPTRPGRWASPTRSARCPSSRAAGRSPPCIAARPWCSSRARPRGSACRWPRRWPAGAASGQRPARAP